MATNLANKINMARQGGSYCFQHYMFYLEILEHFPTKFEANIGTCSHLCISQTARRLDARLQIFIN